MNKTIKMYYTDKCLYKFSAEVVMCSKYDDGFVTVLNQTCFYPEGGGQPCDLGIIDDGEVSYVWEKDGVIFHKTNKEFKDGTTVLGMVDKKRRFSFTQHHSGEHIVSGIVHKLLGFDNVGFHMGKELVTMDFNGRISNEEITKIERLANVAVFRNIEMKEFYPSKEELKTLFYRSKKELIGDVRIIEIPDYDICACCGTHVSRTGEIGIIKLISAQSYKGGTRVGLLCGMKALEDYGKKLEQAKSISAMLSAKVDDVSEAVARLMEEKDEYKLKITQLQNEIFDYKVKHLPKDNFITYIFEDDLSSNDIRRFCCALMMENKKGYSAVFSGDDEKGYKYALGSNTLDVKSLCKEMNNMLNGKGGGKEIVQGSFTTQRSKIEKFLIEKNSTI